MSETNNFESTVSDVNGAKTFLANILEGFDTAFNNEASMASKAMVGSLGSIAGYAGYAAAFYSGEKSLSNTSANFGTDTFAGAAMSAYAEKVQVQDISKKAKFGKVFGVGIAVSGMTTVVNGVVDHGYKAFKESDGTMEDFSHRWSELAQNTEINSGWDAITSPFETLTQATLYYGNEAGSWLGGALYEFFNSEGDAEALKANIFAEMSQEIMKDDNLFENFELPQELSSSVDQMFESGLFDVSDINTLDNLIDNIVQNSTQSGTQETLRVIRRDPLTLDLDGDGIETVGADGSVLFDSNADGVKRGTGWVGADDGLLVRDIDGSGTIDNGQELFGDATVKSDGSIATDGFDALSDLDSNNDGVFDANDAAFEDVKVWQDKNQDGISQADEL
ncbi:hypothetical protein, partial [Francisella tularensis]|uniref:hypothetical protein n=1 Tax=Francisella tularensis TaxID=263 RepID=UPI001F1A85BC